MVDVSKLEIKEHLNVERPNLRVLKIGNKNWENGFISKRKYKIWQNCEQCRMLNGRTILK